MVTACKENGLHNYSMCIRFMKDVLVSCLAWFSRANFAAVAFAVHIAIAEVSKKWWIRFGPENLEMEVLYS